MHIRSIAEDNDDGGEAAFERGKNAAWKCYKP